MNKIESLEVLTKNSYKNINHDLIINESKVKMQEAINDLWTYTDELFHQTDADKAMVEAGIGVDVTKLKEGYYKNVSDLLLESTLEVPESKYFQKGGKEGVHTEHLGYLLTELQFMQRTYPNMEW